MRNLLGHLFTRRILFAPVLLVAGLSGLGCDSDRHYDDDRDRRGQYDDRRYPDRDHRDYDHHDPDRHDDR